MQQEAPDGCVRGFMVVCVGGVLLLQAVDEDRDVYSGVAVLVFAGGEVELYAVSSGSLDVVDIEELLEFVGWYHVSGLVAAVVESEVEACSLTSVVEVLPVGFAIVGPCVDVGYCDSDGFSLLELEVDEV